MIAPTFVSTDSEAILAEYLELYKDLFGKDIQPAQPEMLIINAAVYREVLLRQQLQSAAEMMLVDFSRAPAIDSLAALVGVSRLPAASASCTIDFGIEIGHNGIVIPSGTRIGTTDGQFIFAITENITVPVGQNTATATAFATQTGVAGNGYAIGTVTKILDPRPFLSTATNSTVTSGGSNDESDDELRERIKLAPSQFSVAGPKEAYKFFARSASSSIIDVGVTSPAPGDVNVYPLVDGGGSTPQSILDLVNAALNDEKVRPLSDTVNVLSPTIVNYTIEIDVVIYSSADPVEVEDTITAALNTYVDERARRLGLDIRIDQITALAVYDVDKVFDVTVNEPTTDLTISETTVAVCTGVTVTITGTNDG